MMRTRTAALPPSHEKHLVLKADVRDRTQQAPAANSQHISCHGLNHGLARGNTKNVYYSMFFGGGSVGQASLNDKAILSSKSLDPPYDPPFGAAAQNRFFEWPASSGPGSMLV